MRDNEESEEVRQEKGFFIHDLKVEVIIGGPNFCEHKIGDYFELAGQELSIPAGKTFSIYVLAALLPLLPAKQRPLQEYDWMLTDEDVICPDPRCGAKFRITRMPKRFVLHKDQSGTPLKVDEEESKVH